MRNTLSRKGLVLGIILWFVGTSVMPSFGKTVNNIRDGDTSLDEGLIGFWNLNEGTGNITYDQSGNGHDGTIYGATWITGISDNALDFDGFDDYVDVGQFTQFGGTQSFSLCAWINTTSIQTGEPSILSNMNSSAGGIMLFSDGDRTAVTVGGKDGTNEQITVFYDNSINDGQWHFITGTYDGDYLCLYIDGIIVGSQNDFSNYTASIYNMNIGRMDDLDRMHFDGAIDEVRIYDIALSDSDIQFLYQNPDGSENQPPVADFLWIPQNPLPEQIITFNASTSYDTDGLIILYEWDWNNDDVYEESNTSPTATYSWSDAGNYLVTLQVTDDIGETDTLTKTINIEDGNQPPKKPDRPSGPQFGGIGKPHSYITGTADPDGDQVYYMWDWGDGTLPVWIGPFESNEMISTNHTWESMSLLQIKVKAKDTSGAESDWSESLPVIMPKTAPPIISLLQWILERYPHAFPILRHLLGY
jgi:hypothetical protein